MRLYGVSQLYAKMNSQGKIILFLAKVIDDMLIAGSPAAMTNFRDQLASRYELRKSIIDGPVIYNGCRFEQDGDG